MKITKLIFNKKIDNHIPILLQHRTREFSFILKRVLLQFSKVESFLDLIDIGKVLMLKSWYRSNEINYISLDYSN